MDIYKHNLHSYKHSDSRIRQKHTVSEANRVQNEFISKGSL